jgi:pseudaminic acid cytidylyltransferase
VAILKKMKRLAIIPARGGSKRIPRKNIKNFLGKPIIAYSIEAALKSGLFDEVMVSTDDAEIAEIAKKFGAKVPFLRSAKNADDFATTADVLVEVLETYNAQNQAFDTMCCIYSTAPFITSERLQEGCELLETKKYSTVLPVLKFSFPIQRAVSLDTVNKVAFFQPEYQLTRSQDLTAAFHDSGQFYWLSVSSFVETKKIWTDNTGAIILTEMEVQDIDTLEDWEIAEFKYKLKNER